MSRPEPGFLRMHCPTTGGAAAPQALERRDSLAAVDCLRRELAPLAGLRNQEAPAGPGSMRAVPGLQRPPPTAGLAWHRGCRAPGAACIFAGALLVPVSRRMAREQTDFIDQATSNIRPLYDQGAVLLER